VTQAASVIFGSHVRAVELAIAVALVSAGYLAYRGARLAIAGNMRGAGFFALALWLIIPNPYPWYALWILPVAFIAFRERISWAIIAATLTIFVRYLPDMSSAAHWDLNLAATLFAIGAPWLAALWPSNRLGVTEALRRAAGAYPELVEASGTSADARNRTGFPIR